MRHLLLLLLLLTAATAPARAQNIAGRLDAALLRAQDTLAESFGRSLPLPSVSAGCRTPSTPRPGTSSASPPRSGRSVLPLNDGFVRTDPIPLIGVEATF